MSIRPVIGSDDEGSVRIMNERRREGRIEGGEEDEGEEEEGGTEGRRGGGGRKGNY